MLFYILNGSNVTVEEIYIKLLHNYSYSRIVSIKRIVSHFAVSVLKDNMHLVLGLPFTV